jgi:hypothetical protein
MSSGTPETAFGAAVEIPPALLLLVLLAAEAGGEMACVLPLPAEMLLPKEKTLPSEDVPRESPVPTLKPEVPSMRSYLTPVGPHHKQPG